MLNEDYREILQSLLKNEVRFLIVGAYAMGAHGYPRATGDFDIWVDATRKNAARVYRSLADFGAPLSTVTEKTFSIRGIVFQIGVPPRRIDILTHIDGVTFKQAFKTKDTIKISGLCVPFLSKQNLIKNKLSTGRQKDKIDAAYLKNR